MTSDERAIFRGFLFACGYERVGVTPNVTQEGIYNEVWMSPDGGMIALTWGARSFSVPKMQEIMNERKNLRGKKKNKEEENQELDVNAIMKDLDSLFQKKPE